MNRFERRYKGGEIIFREGDASTSAYVVVSGQVELIKRTGKQAVRLALLNPGEMFGEMGIVDESPRSATARAVGDVAVDVVERDEFLEAVKKRPDVALAVIGNLSERLRATNEQVSRRQSQPQSGVTSIAGYARLWALVRQFLVPAKKAERKITMLVMPIDGDEGLALSMAIVQALDGYDGMQARLVEDNLVEDEETVTLHELLTAARRKLDETGASLLIWGAVNDTGTAVHLRFVSHQLDDDYPGAFYPSDRLSLPAKLTKELWRMLAAVCIAATVPKTVEQRLILRGHLTPAFEAARASKQEPPMELNRTDQASIQVCYGNIAALLGYQTGDIKWYQEAALAYQEALEAVSQADSPLDWATIQRHLAVVRQVLGERAGDEQVLENAAEGYRAAITTFTRQAFPWEWASLQARLGVTLYRLDTIKGDLEILKDGIAALQSATQIFSRDASPYRWADVKNSLGQALQVWGDEARSPELLERAVQSCQEALQVRSRELTPMLWAASQNNLGSALFMLGRMTEDSEHLEGAATAFAGALEVYKANGSARLAKVAERNLARTEELLRGRLARSVAKLYWEDGEADALPAPGEAAALAEARAPAAMLEDRSDAAALPTPPGVVPVEAAAALRFGEEEVLDAPRKPAKDRPAKALTELDV